MSSDTQSAFTDLTHYYLPEFMKPWRNITTRMSVDIKKQGQTSSVPSFPQTTQYGIYSGTSHNFNFLWQTSKDTVPGVYTVTMTSTVPDEKCDQSTMQAVTKTMDVNIAPSIDGCRAQVMNFASSGSTVNYNVSFGGTRLHAYQDWNYSLTSPCTVDYAYLAGGKAFPVYYRLTVRNLSNNAIKGETTGSLPAIAQLNTAESFNVKWKPTECGSYSATINMTSSGDTSSCSADAKSAVATLTFNIGSDADHDGFFDQCGDCNDNNVNIFPGNTNPYCDCIYSDGKNPTTEICDGIDNNCNGQIDEGLSCPNINFYCDNDKDGLKSSTISGTCAGTETACISYYSTNCSTSAGTDCNDANPSMPLTYFRDADLDGYGNPNVPIQGCTQPPGYVSNSGDCDDGSIAIKPGAIESCHNGIDDNCDGHADCADSACSLDSSCRVCTPSGAEICDGADNNCDGLIDKTADGQDLSESCYSGPEGTAGVGACIAGIRTCSNGQWGGCIGEAVPSIEDCTTPGDEDCNGLSDCADPACSGLPECASPACTMGDNAPPCYQLLGYQNKGICKDVMAQCVDGQWACDISLVQENSTEGWCDGLDNDCDGLVDEGCDADRDGFMTIDPNFICLDNFIDGNNQTKSCDQQLDCDDSNANINPSKQEICGDGIDNNCDGTVDEGCNCTEGETIECGISAIGECRLGTETCQNGAYGQCNGAVSPRAEACDGKDNDCNGAIDDSPECCSAGMTKACSNDPECPGVSGQAACEGLFWGECSAECPIIPNIKILSPKQQTYYTCQDTTNVFVQVNYNVPNVSCMMSMGNAFAAMDQVINAKIGKNNFTVRCGSDLSSVIFDVRRSNCTTEPFVLTSLSSDYLKKQGVTDQELSQYALTPVDEDIQYSEDDTGGHYTINLKTDKQLKNMTLLLDIPKCMAQVLDDIKFDYDKYQVRKSDPLIAWRVSSMAGSRQFTFHTSEKVDPECWKQIKGLPIADVIESQMDSGPANFSSFIIAMIVTGMAIGIFVFVQANRPRARNMDDAIRKGKDRILAQVKSVARDRQEAEQTVKAMNLSESDKEYVLRNFK